MEAQIHPANTSSRRVLEKLGFVQEGYFHENYYDPVENEFTDTAVFSGSIEVWYDDDTIDRWGIEGRRNTEARMANVSVKRVIEAQAVEIWQIVRAFEQPDLLLSGVSYTIEGTGIGCYRTIKLAEGAEVTEKLLVLDDESGILRYEIVDPAPIPVTNYVGLMSVRELGRNRSEVEWSCHFQPRDVPEATIEGMIKQAFTNALERRRERYNQ